MLIEQIPTFIRCFFKPVMWRGNTKEKKIFLTFDDGPTPEVTPWVLNLLDEYNVKATFFCIGNNVEKYPDLFLEIKNRGHQVGNHAYSHKRGMYRNTPVFFEDINKAQELIQSHLFRPPHGHITPRQINVLKNQYSIVLWDVITRDYDTTLKADTVYNNVVKYSRNGSVVVFHDSIKAEKNLRYALPKSLEFWTKKGYQLSLIE
jgi:peptidoglycan-N-acetylglucosamine deacetylase